MDLLRVLLFPAFLSLSCAKVSYLVEQGMGQMNLQQEARANDDVLNDPKVREEDKEKIRLVGVYKKFFYDYFSRPQTEIYNKTTLLERPAVTYLVIASPVDEVKAKEECFFFMGCFPYLGFFNEDSARGYQKRLESENWVTWQRPVYAYSTLGYLTDNILSSFFHYQSEELAELIFHELFHTLFFVKDEIDLNENLANYFAQKMVIEYFKFDQQKRSSLFQEAKSKAELDQLIVRLIKELQSRYEELKVPAGTWVALRPQDVLEGFLRTRFIPTIKKFCEEKNLTEKNCHPLHKEWNNARFAAFLTYEKESVDIEKLHQQKGGDLRAFLGHLEQRLNHYKNDHKSGQLTFTAYLFEGN